VRVIAKTWSRLRLDWEIALHRLPFFTQKVAVMLLGALVASLALLGGVVALVGPPGADGPDQLVPGDTGGPPATTRPAPAQPGRQGAGATTTSAPAGAPAPGRAADHRRARHHDHHRRPGRAAAAGGRRQLGGVHAAAVTAMG
jgi:hypothetical protein